MKTYKIPTDIEITEEDIDNIVDAAINWCSYWCRLLEYGTEPKDCKFMSEALSHGGTLVFHLDESYERRGKFELTTDKMLKGLAAYHDHDFDNFDGPMSDAVLQLALFGEVVYG